MSEPSRRTSRLLLAGGAAASLALLATGFVLGRRTVLTPPAPPPPAVAPAPAPTPQPSPPTLPPVLGRADILSAATVAADAYSAARAPVFVPPLVGRRFELRVPFGCRGAAPEGLEEALRWSYDADAQALRVRAEPATLPVAEWVPQPAQAAVEAVEGFWIARPWSLSEDCPPSSAGDAPPPHTSTLGVVQFHSREGRRALRRDGEAFEATVKVAPDALDASRGLRLVLRGRVSAAPGGGAFRCRAPGPDIRPTCLLAAEFDEVAIENAATGAVLAEWTG